MSALYVVPCGAAKLDRPAPAAQLYSSAHFRLVLDAARAAAGARGDGSRVAILSALHGLVWSYDVLAPYDVTMRDAGSVSWWQLQVQLAALVDDAGVQQLVTLLPRAYRDRLAPAAEALQLPLLDLYAGARGIGDQRAIASKLRASVGVL